MNGLLTYKYYDTPEGHDVFKKVFVTSKYAAVTGLAMGSADVLMFSHPKGFVQSVGRFGFYLGPLVGMAVAFTVTANGLQGFRGKNDSLNYFMGGVAAGAIGGQWLRSATAGVPLALALGAIAVIKKTGIDCGWTFFPEHNNATQSASSVRNDWTLVKDIEELKTWSVK